jgi:replication factor C subunit 2/4
MSTQNLDSVPWFEKYRPRRLADMTQTQNLLDLFKNSIETGDMTHYLFYGPPGTGKTSAILAMGREIFKEYFQTRVIEFNASDDRGINAVREKISNDAKKYVTETVSEDGSRIPPYKIIILDEADSMTDEAQDALRVIIEQYSGVTRFCFICNYISKITDAIKSRCTPVYFKKLSNECMVGKLNEIAVKESMELPKKILNTIIDVSNGDMRKAIMMLKTLNTCTTSRTALTNRSPKCNFPN